MKIARAGAMVAVVISAGLLGGSCGGTSTTSTRGTGGSAGSVASGGGGTAGAVDDLSGGIGGAGCPQGSETCPCYPNSTCNAGLDCLVGVCVDLGAGGVSTGGATGSGGQPSESGGAPGMGGDTSESGGATGAGGATGEGGSAPGAGGTQTAGAGGAGGVHTAGAGASAGATPGTGGAAGACPEITGLEDCDFPGEPAALRSVNVLLVLDKSGSMANTVEGYDSSKWEALGAAVGAALSESQGVISYGLELFPTTATVGSPIPLECGDTGRCCEMPTDAEMNVPIGTGTTTVPDIIPAVQANEPAGGTPASVALQRAHAYFTTGAGAELTGEKYVLLVTDGAPNCNSNISCDVTRCTLNVEDASGCPSDGANCCANYPEACLDDGETLTHISNLQAAGVSTIVVGMPGTELYAANLNEFALAGGFPQVDGDESYFAVAVSGGDAELVETFRSITNQLVPHCQVAVPDPLPNPNELNVAVDCELVFGGPPTGTEDRWYYDDSSQPTTVIIDGPLCDLIKGGAVERIDTVRGCPLLHSG